MVNRRKSGRLDPVEVVEDSFNARDTKNRKTYSLLFKETKRLSTKVGETDDLKLKEIFYDAALECLKKLELAFLELSDSDVDDNFIEFSNLKDDCLKLKAEFMESSHVNTATLEHGSQAGKSILKLPKIGLIDFQGEMCKWLSFRDIFTNAIIKNENLNDLQRLTYLQSCVKNEAARIIRGFEITEENFKNAWESLTNRYENKKELIFAHLRKIFELKSIKVANSKNLLEIVDVVNESLRNLETLQLKADKFTEYILIFNLQTKLDSETLKQWELHSDSKEISTLKCFLEFLEKQSRSFVASTSVNTKFESKCNKSSLISANANVNNISNFQCNLCASNHPIFKCPQYNAMSLKERWTMVKNKRLCSNCLKGKHFYKQCINQGRCKNCSRKHHTSLHSYIPDISNGLGFDSKCRNSRISNRDNISPTTEQNNVPTESNETPCLSTNATLGCNTLLSTARIRVRNNQGQYKWARVLVDNGSQKTLITKSFQEKLCLPTQTSKHTIIGINNLKAETSVEKVNLQFSPHFNDEVFYVEALVVNKVTSDLPNFEINIGNWPHLSNLILADPSYHICAPIDMILGADLFFHLINGSPILGPKGAPSALNTKLGFLLSGSVYIQQQQSSPVSCHTTLTIDQQLTRFWELENLPETLDLTSHDQLCEQSFQNSISRDNTGRYCVGLPFKPNIIVGNTYSSALKRFYALEAQFAKRPDFKKSYSNFMTEYLTLGHMQPVKDSSENPRVCYLPHHGVFKENSTTTKLRAVFDGSMKSDSGYSLNDALLTGPKLQSSLFTLLVRFRAFPIAVNADIQMMYRQVNINSKDTDMQRILWRFKPSDPIQIFRLTTITYGLSSSPFLALRTLKQLALDEQVDFPEASKVLLTHFYIDDLLSGANDVKEAQCLVVQLNTLLQKGQFTLRKWRSNCPEVLTSVPDNLKSNSSILNIEADQTQNILGLRWNSVSDTFNINIGTFKEVNSKRSLLSFIAKTFDPLGILSPTTIMLKIMLQELWKDKRSWDDNLPPEIYQKWLKFQTSLDILKSISVPRYINYSPGATHQLIGFSDASTRAYAAVIYLRTVESNNAVTVNLIAAKTKVAPTKPLTLPKLELSAMFLLSKLVDSVITALPFQVSNTFLWSDSQIAISWVNSDIDKKDIFITNRVKKIQTLTPNVIWSYVASADNPSDCASRGIYPQQLLNHPIWWTGPTWLTDSSFSSHVSTIAQDILNSKTIQSSIENCSSSMPITIPEETQCFLTTHNDFSDLIMRFSSYSKLIRVVAWILRFVNNAKNTQLKTLTYLTAQELHSSMICLVKVIQSTEFSADLTLLKQKKPLSSKSKLHSLNVFLDNQDLLRVGGRLSQGQGFNFDKKHPLVLPSKHQFTKLLVTYLHIKHLHAGQQLVLSFLRNQFWITNGRDTVRKILHNCLTCFRLKSQPCTQLMGNLPQERITFTRPFATVGVDFTGAFLTKPNVPRSKIKLKSYICLFVCMATKAIHLELVSELTVSSFIACLRHFISRRGLPTDIFSDNASNFRGTATYLNHFCNICKDPNTQQFCADQMIEWHFIPAYSPNFGGLWEACIKLTKTHLLRTCKSNLLNFEQLSTLLCQIEAIINSRPIVPLSSDTNDLQALTPGHFIIGSSLLDIPTTSHPIKSLPLSTQWNNIQTMRHHFWTRWSTEYLHQLQPRSKWSSVKPDLKVGQLVLICDPQLPPLSWMTGRVTKLFPGNDGHVRVVSLKTKKGDISRSISRLSVFPNSNFM